MDDCTKMTIIYTMSDYKYDQNANFLFKSYVKNYTFIYFHNVCLDYMTVYNFYTCAPAHIKYIHSKSYLLLNLDY